MIQSYLSSETMCLTPLELIAVLWATFACVTCLIVAIYKFDCSRFRILFVNPVLYVGLFAGAAMLLARSEIGCWTMLFTLPLLVLFTFIFMFNIAYRKRIINLLKR